jgi:hypothetical protein
MHPASIARRGLFLVAALVALAACQSENVVTPSGTLILQHAVITEGVTQLRALGFDASAQVSFGPATMDVAASVALSGVSVTTTAIELVYFNGDSIAGLVRVPVTVTTGTTTVSVPAFDALASPATALSVSPSDVTLAAGLAQSFTATATFEDGTSRNLSSAVEWSVSDTTLAEVSVAGLVTTHAKGTVTLTAKFETVSNQVTITIVPATVTSIELTPAHLAITPGQQVQLTATAHLSDGTTEDITATAEWSASSGTVTAGLVTSTQVGAIVVRATGGGQTGETTVNVFPTPLGALEIQQGAALALSKGTNRR